MWYVLLVQPGCHWSLVYPVDPSEDPLLSHTTFSGGIMNINAQNCLLLKSSLDILYQCPWGSLSNYWNKGHHLLLGSCPMLSLPPGAHCAEFHPAHCTYLPGFHVSSLWRDNGLSDLPLLVYCLFIKPQPYFLPQMKIFFLSLKQKHWFLFPFILPDPLCIHLEESLPPPSSQSRWQL